MYIISSKLIPFLIISTVFGYVDLSEIKGFYFATSVLKPLYKDILYKVNQDPDLDLQKSGTQDFNKERILCRN